MVYQQKLVAVIKHNGKILREVDNNTVLLPFQAEYEIFIKNLESRDAVLNISIDGQDVLDNQSIVIKANSSASLEGFLKNNKVSNRFKFIQKTGKIQEYRGDRVDDGLIRIEYRFTKINQTITITHRDIYDTHWHHPHWCECPRCRLYRVVPYQITPFWHTQPIITYGGGVSRTTYAMSSNNLSDSGVNSSPKTLSANYVSNDVVSTKQIGEAIGGSIKGSVLNNSVTSNAFMPQFDTLPLPSEGITVKGSESDQQLVSAATSPLEDQSYTIILKLRGCDKLDQPVEKPVLVKTKVKCSTCGRNNRSHVKYCPECGTALF